MSPNPEGVAFAGPTLHGIEDRARTDRAPLRWMPPVRRGDVDRLVAAESPQLMVIVDGQFHNCLSVAHREIVSALDAGWEVWGLASMGAIRAYELRELGMHGFGEVYERFFLEEDFRDDEVAVLHDLEPPYRARSEPLVHIRVALADLVDQGVVGRSAADGMLETLAARWFGERTLGRLRELALSGATAATALAVQRWLDGFSRYRIKSRDLERFISARWPEQE